MELCTRRQVLAKGSVGLTGCVVTSGCFFDSAGRRGVNKILAVENNSVNQVQLHILVEKNRPPGSQNLRTTFENKIPIQSNQVRELEVLGEDQFRITVTGLGQKTVFWTRPICNTASTRAIVKRDEKIISEVEWCE